MRASTSSAFWTPTERVRRKKRSLRLLVLEAAESARETRFCGCHKRDLLGNKRRVQPEDDIDAGGGADRTLVWLSARSCCSVWVGCSEVRALPDSMMSSRESSASAQYLRGAAPSCCAAGGRRYRRRSPRVSSVGISGSNVISFSWICQRLIRSRYEVHTSQQRHGRPCRAAPNATVEGVPDALTH